VTNGKIKYKTYLVFFLFFVNYIDIEIFLTYFVLHSYLSFYLFFFCFLTAISEDTVAVQVSVLIVHLVGTKMVKVTPIVRVAMMVKNQMIKRRRAKKNHGKCQATATKSTNI